MPQPPNLRELQERFSALIRAPRGVAAHLPAAPAEERELCLRWVASTRELSNVERLEIYANMYFYRLHDAVADDFPVVRACIGNDHFHNVLTDYFLAHPSHHFSLRHAGNRLPAFLRAHRLRERWPFLPELAWLEWLVVEAFDAPDSPVAGAGELLRVPPEAWGSMRISWIPALFAGAFAWPVHTLWKAAQASAPLPEIEPRPCWIAVWRQGESVFVAEIEAWQGRWLGRCEPLAALITERARESDEGRAAEEIASWLAGCVGDGWIRSVTWEGDR